MSERKHFKEISEERDKQDLKFGPQNHKPVEWCMILGEEVGEVQKAALESYFRYEGKNHDYSEYRNELIQVAAVSISMIECFDRNRK
ncbi:MazG-like family protein [Leptospira noguchii]|nr:MazG-like family protein [Leptospira noguchii]